ncbi:MAG: hypothetical protein EOM64_09165, partial [Erysipelotrichia bacterium]|nr:hypothetical protein [Erysipelotrichia bacterium]
MIRRPMIALSPRSNSETDTSRKYSDNESYFTFVSRNGGIPMMTGTVVEETADQIASQMDGLLISGGEDVDPARYGMENTFSEVIDSDLDETDILLYHIQHSLHFRQL